MPCRRPPAGRQARAAPGRKKARSAEGGPGFDTACYASAAVTSAGATRGANSPVDRRDTAFVSPGIYDSTARRSWNDAAHVLSAWGSLEPHCTGNFAQPED